MSLHIQMSEETEAELRKANLRNKISSTLACLLFMVLGGGILYFATIYIVGDIPVAFIQYVPPQDDAPPTSNPVQKELSSRSSPASSDVAPNMIIAVNATNTQMPPVAVSLTDGLSMDASLDMGIGIGSGIGDGLGSGGSGLGSGTSGGSALEGTFYDLKQTKSGAKTGIEPANQVQVVEALAEFLKNWNASSLGKYYSSPQKLYASNFYLPTASANYAPVAYQCKDRVKPSAWLAIYRGRVRAPESGTYRFIGTGDDFLAVRFNRQLVLDAGYRLPTIYEKGKKTWHVSKAGDLKGFQERIKSGRDSQRKEYEFINSIKECRVWNDELGGLIAGKPFKVEEGKAYPIEILISEIPGGLFGFVLFIEKADANGKFNSKAAKYDLFRTNFSAPNAAEVKKLLQEANCMGHAGFENIPYNEDSPIWTAVP